MDRQAQTHLSESQASEHVEAVVRRSGSSFYWGMRRMEPKRRQAMYAIYAFCREVDDIADGDQAEDRKRALLDGWRQDIERLYAGEPTTATTVALRPAIENFGLRREDFQAIIDGMEMDAPPRVRIADLDELLLYCDRVACAVGRLCVRIFGLDPSRGDALATALGLALQLTNILRDIAEDAERDRIYLPRDLLHAAAIPGDDVEAMLDHPDLAGICGRIAGMAEDRFAEAEGIIEACDPVRVRPAVMMKEVYRRILVKLRHAAWHDSRRRIGLSKPVKLWVAFRYGLLG